MGHVEAPQAAGGVGLAGAEAIVPEADKNGRLTDGRIRATARWDRPVRRTTAGNAHPWLFRRSCGSAAYAPAPCVPTWAPF